MKVEFKLKTYKEPINNKDELFDLTKNRNRTGYYATVANFVYDINTKTIYDAISHKTYREVRHEICLSGNGFNFTDIEPDNFIRFEFSTTDCYNSLCQYTGKYRACELGIEGLMFSGLYYDFPKYRQRATKLKSYDLDIIESYVETLKAEQQQIRATEINLNLPKKADMRKKRKF